MIYRWYDIPYGYDICVADDIRSAYGGVATPQIKIMGSAHGSLRAKSQFIEQLTVQVES